MNSINVTDKERDWIHVALVSKAIEVRKHAEKPNQKFFRLLK